MSFHLPPGILGPAGSDRRPGPASADGMATVPTGKPNIPRRGMSPLRPPRVRRPGPPPLPGVVRPTRVRRRRRTSGRADRYGRGVSHDPLVLGADLDRATARLLATVQSLDDRAVAGSSLLPGWSRGHVLTHLARNADGAVNLLTWAATGVRTPQYPSIEARAADIDTGAPRPLAEQLADLTASAQRLARAVQDLPAPSWTVEVEWLSGNRSPAQRVVWSRLQEVEVHHVDLDAGYAPADWPEAFTLRILHSLVRGMDQRPDGPAALLRTPELGHDVSLRGAQAPVVEGPAAAVVAWLIGRSGGADLTVSGGALPAVPAWA
jgi:maleylpyruvate isomerase